MARRKELKGIASGIYGSFISRNNDVGGYWGIGKLCGLAVQRGTTKVHLDLLKMCMEPPAEEFRKLLGGFNAKLQVQMEARSLPSFVLSAAEIDVDFSPRPPEGRRIPIETWGSLFKLSVSLRDDRGREHIINGYGHCGPHDPKKESKSAGEERF